MQRGTSFSTYIFNEGISYVGISINHSFGMIPQAFDAVGLGTGNLGSGDQNGRSVLVKDCQINKNCLCPP